MSDKLRDEVARAIAYQSSCESCDGAPLRCESCLKDAGPFLSIIERAVLVAKLEQRESDIRAVEQSPRHFGDASRGVCIRSHDAVVAIRKNRVTDKPA